MKKIIVLGAGMVGSAIAVDLSKEYEVTVADRDSHKLNLLREHHPIRTIITDLSSEIKTQEIVIDYDLVIGALPGFMGFKSLRSVISEGKNIVDISFFPEDPFELDKLAKEKNVTAIVDCGVSPGLSNIVLGYYNKRMSVKDYKCVVGGLPINKHWPFHYKAFFSPIDVIEEYMRPARTVEKGKIITREAMSDTEILEFEQVGKLEAFNTDGLRSLLQTMKIPDMVEKTLRYPGHIELMKVFKETGFFSYEEIEIGRNTIRPIDLTAKLIFPFWKPENNEADFTLLQININGEKNGEKEEHIYSLFDQYDAETNVSSMARTTGYTCTAAARLLLNGDYERKGISPPEFIGEDEKCFKSILAYLESKGMKISHVIN
jgi:saccharopine dehydrogenase-like NADP-dependent oxidoreductase